MSLAPRPLTSASSSTAKPTPTKPSPTAERRDALDVPLSPRAREMLDEGLASARRGEVRPWVDFTPYANDPDDE